MNKTVWSSFRDFVNNNRIGTEITRQEIIKNINLNTGMYCMNNSSVSQYMKLKDNKQKTYSVHTLDSLRNMSEKLGYLSKTDELGKYKIVKHFKHNYTAVRLRKDYDNKDGKRKGRLFT